MGTCRENVGKRLGEENNIGLALLELPRLVSFIEEFEQLLCGRYSLSN